MLLRGQIYNREKANMQNDFSGVRFRGNITPTDIDGFIDFGNDGFVFLETKGYGAYMTLGQRKALERLCKAAEGAGIPSIAIKSIHYNVPPEDIDVANSMVHEYWYDGRWKREKSGRTVKQLIDVFLSKNGLKYYL